MMLQDDHKVDGIQVKTIKALLASPKTHPNVKEAWKRKLENAERGQAGRRVSKLSKIS